MAKKQKRNPVYDGVEKVRLYQKVFGGPDGRAVLFDLMATHGILAAHPIEATKMALKEGERLVVLRILALLKTSPNELMERIEEHAQDI